ncbi:MAG TPA: dATP/dGTP pyrophosphohydrolase domain-containing protein [Gammaproteobacteria bacterium]|nr:dATP/dGTP pyrophosphohydrolase domain-containing protein [Gammaproteobacteria bacterium]
MTIAAIQGKCPYCGRSDELRGGPNPLNFNLVAHLHQQRDWSGRTFGPGERTAGVLDHIRKELAEIEATPQDLEEWVDLVLLALDGAWRAGHSPEDIAIAIADKQARNEQREWPDWRDCDPDKAIEHFRS